MYVGLDFENYQILLNKISHRFLVIIKLKSLIAITAAPALPARGQFYQLFWFESRAAFAQIIFKAFSGDEILQKHTKTEKAVAKSMQ